MERRFLSNNKSLLAFGLVAPPLLWWLGSYVLAVLVVVAVLTIITHQFKRAYREWRLRRAHCLPEPSDELPTARIAAADLSHREKILEGSMGAFSRRRSDRLAAKQALPEPATKASKSRGE